MCDCSKTDTRVVYFTTATWANGKTDVQVRQNVKTKCYQVIEHCQEHVTRDGTGMSHRFGYSNKARRAAIALADWYKNNLEERK